MPSKLAARIRQARHRAKLSQAELASKIKVQRSAVSNWESASGIIPATANLIAIAQACEVSLEWLGTGNGVIQPGQEAHAGVLAVDVDYVELPEERELLAVFREMPRRSQAAVLELVRILRPPRSRGR